MKTCPTCDRTFEDTFTFCLVDGSILSAPFDPQVTQVLPTNQNKVPIPTEVLSNQDLLKLAPTQVDIPSSSPIVNEKDKYYPKQALNSGGSKGFLWRIATGSLIGILYGATFLYISFAIQYPHALSESGSHVAFGGAIIGLLQGLLNSIIWILASKYIQSTGKAVAIGAMIGVIVSWFCGIGRAFNIEYRYISDAFFNLYTNFGADNMIHPTLFGLVLGVISAIIYRSKIYSH